MQGKRKLFRLLDILFNRYIYKPALNKRIKVYYKRMDSMPKKYITYGKMPEGKDTWINLDKL